MNDTKVVIPVQQIPPPDARDRADLNAVRSMVAACMQCGTCSASCPNAHAMDSTPRRMWRMAIMGQLDQIMASKTFWLCSACYTCTLRCPRGLPLTDAMAALKRIASRRAAPKHRRSHAFYKAFMDNVRAHGRVQEAGLMFNYFLAVKDPLLPLSYTPLGLKMLMKGKLHPPTGAGSGKLEALFARVRAMEEPQ
ncbi:MAG: 4Fe-4S dicluster domain-containing protein [Desulfovibrionaceae bacterium]